MRAARQYRLVERLALVRRQRLGVVEPVGDAARIEDDRGRHHRTSPGPAARLVDTGNGTPALLSAAASLSNVGPHRGVADSPLAPLAIPVASGAVGTSKWRSCIVRGYVTARRTG